MRSIDAFLVSMMTSLCNVPIDIRRRVLRETWTERVPCAVRFKTMTDSNRNSLLIRSLLVAIALLGVFAAISVFRAKTSVSHEVAASTLEELLTQLYRSFDEDNERAVYRRLAENVTDEQINQIYLEHRRSLDSEERGGPRAKVYRVEILKVRSLRKGDAGSVLIDATWTVSGRVNHFGHVHVRRNRYNAVVKLVPIDGEWKIGTIEVADWQREQ